MNDNNYLDSSYIPEIYKCIAEFFSSHDKKLIDSSSSISHYTSTIVLDCLLKGATFRASHIFYLNDKNEYIIGMNEIKKLISSEDLNLDFTSEDLGIYTISFTDGTDLLQQWITYAKESGVSIELDKNLLLSKRNSFVFDIGCGEPGINAKDALHSMLYKNPKPILHEEKIRSGFSKAIFESIDQPSPMPDDVWNIAKYSHVKKEYLRLLASYIKDDNFSAEKEVRASFVPGNKGSKQLTGIEYMPRDNGILRPYINVTIKSDVAESGVFIPCLPVKSITVGPSGNQQAVFDSVVHRIKYGANKVYDYSIQDKDAFRENFATFFHDAVIMAIEKTTKSVKEDVYKKTYEQLWLSIYDPDNPIDMPIIPSYDEISKSQTTTSDKANTISQDDLFSYIMKNNHFSKEGIWIKKSSIPYIF